VCVAAQTLHTPTHRFRDGSQLYWQLCRSILEQLSGQTLNIEETQRLAKEMLEFERRTDLYYAYANIHAFATDPFTSSQPDVLFQSALFIMNNLSTDEVPPGMSRAFTLYTLGRQSMILGAFKLAR
jgi:intraflagellar transport protein 122